jgi:hypothetical protein
MAEEGPQMRAALAQANKQTNSNVEVIGNWPFYDGVPMVKISCAAAELIPTQAYGNVSVGPTQITYFASPDGQVLFDEPGIKAAISLGQKMCEASVAEERETVAVLMRSNVAAGNK